MDDFSNPLFIEIGDSVLVNGKNRLDRVVSKNMQDKVYVYKLKLPVLKATPKNFRKLLNQDLERYFQFESEMALRS